MTSQLGLMSLITLIFVKKSLKAEWSLFKFCATGVCLLIVFPIPYLWLRIGENPIAWIISEIFDKPWRLQLMAIWIVAAASAIVVVCYELRSSTNWEKTRLRKVFHFFVTIAVASGIFIDSDLTILATVAIFCVQIMVEFVRVEEISPVAEHLNMVINYPRILSLSFLMSRVFILGLQSIFGRKGPRTFSSNQYIPLGRSCVSFMVK